MSKIKPKKTIPAMWRGCLFFDAQGSKYGAMSHSPKYRAIPHARGGAHSSQGCR